MDDVVEQNLIEKDDDIGVPISVIVPFYNTGDRAPYCLNSLLNQDFDNYEIIAVDDGSTDETGSILERYSFSYPIIKVFHKNNGGVSDARNYGVRHSVGKYITFVDSDDIVSPFYLSSMYAAMQDAPKRMVITRIRNIKLEDAESFSGWEKGSNCITLSKEKVARMTLFKELGTQAPARLAPREIYERFPFPSGVRYEEIRSNPVFVRECDDFRYIPDTQYAYIMRPGSIVWTNNAKLDQALEYRDAIEQCVELYLQICPDEHDSAVFFDVLMSVRLHDFLVRVKERSEECDELENSIYEKAVRNRALVRNAKAVPLAKRLRVLLYSYSPSLYDIIYRIYTRKTKGVG